MTLLVALLVWPVLRTSEYGGSIYDSLNLFGVSIAAFVYFCFIVPFPAVGISHHINGYRALC